MLILGAAPGLDRPPGCKDYKPLNNFIMNKPTKIRAIGAAQQMTEEQKKEAATRAFLQKRNALAEGILYNAIQSSHGTRIDGNGRPDFLPAVEAAIKAADAFMQQAYGLAAVEERPAENE